MTDATGAGRAFGQRLGKLIESKMIQKAKHAAEKAAKVAREHPDLKRAHPTLRASIAVLGGDFTREPLRMVEASGAHVLFIPQDHIAAACRERGMNILWEDARAGPAALAALSRYGTLTQDDLRDVGRRLLEPVAGHLVEVIRSAIADAPTNPVTGVWVDIFFKRGEISHHEFPSVPEALDYLNSWSEQRRGPHARRTALLRL